MHYSIVIIGGGPAGYAAALYAARAGQSVAVLEMLSAGGQMATTEQVDNYPGFADGIDGFALGEQMQAGAEKFGAHTHYTEVQSLDLTAQPKIIQTDSDTYTADAVILATGANPRTLGLAQEQALCGRGVSYCATCDGNYYKGKTVAVIGGGNAAAGEALVLAALCEKVYLVHRRDTLRAEESYLAPLQAAENIEFVWNHTVSDITVQGEGFRQQVAGVQLTDVRNGVVQQIAVDGVFVAVGRKPATDLYRGQIDLDANGYVIAGENTRTNLTNVYAAGDLRTKTLRQIVTAVADGAVAATEAVEHLAKQ